MDSILEEYCKFIAGLFFNKLKFFNSLFDLKLEFNDNMSNKDILSKYNFGIITLYPKSIIKYSNFIKRYLIHCDDIREIIYTITFIELLRCIIQSAMYKYLLPFKTFRIRSFLTCDMIIFKMLMNQNINEYDKRINAIINKPLFNTDIITIEFSHVIGLMGLQQAELKDDNINFNYGVYELSDMDLNGNLYDNSLCYLIDSIFEVDSNVAKFDQKQLEYTHSIIKTLYNVPDLLIEFQSKDYKYSYIVKGNSRMDTSAINNAIQIFHKILHTYMEDDIRASFYVYKKDGMGESINNSLGSDNGVRLVVEIATDF